MPARQETRGATDEVCRAAVNPKSMCRKGLSSRASIAQLVHMFVRGTTRPKNARSGADAARYFHDMLSGI